MSYITEVVGRLMSSGERIWLPGDQRGRNCWTQCFDIVLVNKLVPCAWLSSGALEVWRLHVVMGWFWLGRS